VGFYVINNLTEISILYVILYIENIHRLINNTDRTLDLGDFRSQ